MFPLSSFFFLNFNFPAYIRCMARALICSDACTSFASSSISNQAQRSIGITRNSIQVTVPEPTPEMLAALDRASAAAATAAAATTSTVVPNVPLWTTQTESVRSMLEGGKLRGRLVLFPHHFLHGEALEAHIAARFLVGKRLFQ